MYIDDILVGTMLGITHFAIGATGGLLLNQKLNYDRLLIPILSGVFAMFGDLNKLIYIEYLNDTVLNNVFWFHKFLDSIETSYPEIEGVIALLLLITVTVYFR